MCDVGQSRKCLLPFDQGQGPGGPHVPLQPQWTESASSITPGLARPSVDTQGGGSGLAQPAPSALQGAPGAGRGVRWKLGGHLGDTWDHSPAGAVRCVKLAWREGQQL